MKPTCIELFAGAGGLALGLEMAGFEHHGLVERDKTACQTLQLNRPFWPVLNYDVKHLSDLVWPVLNFSDIDLIAGGFPCQPFSYAGNRKGLEDPVNGTAFGYMIDFVKLIKPKMLLLENVPGLIKHEQGKTFNTIIESIVNAGYKIMGSYVLNANDYLVPQNRKRLFIIALRNDLESIIEVPKPYDYKPTLRDALYASPLYATDCPVSAGKPYPQRKIDLYKHIPQGGYWRDLPSHLKQYYMERPSYGKGGNTGTLRRLQLDKPSLTIMCRPDQNQTDRCHPLHDRPLTTRESARVQSFTDDWEFCGSITQQYKQIGNAVPVNLAYSVGLALKSVLDHIPPNLSREFV